MGGLTGLDGREAGGFFDEAVEEGEGGSCAGALEVVVLGLAFSAQRLDVFWVEAEVVDGECDGLVSLVG